MTTSDNPLFLELNLQQVLFNNVGQFYMTIWLQGSLEKQNDVKLFINNSKSPHGQSYFTTQPYSQSDVTEPVNLDSSILLFHLPPGFIEQDVYLIVEVHRFSQYGEQEESKYGESVLLVYPNKDTLFPSAHHAKNTNQENVLYKIEKQLPFTAQSEFEGISVNVGSLWLDAELRQELKDKPQPAKKAASNLQPLTDEPGPSISLPEQDIAPVPPPSQKVSEVGPVRSPVQPSHLCGSYVTREGYCQAVLLVHAAVGLPVRSDGSLPQPSVICKRHQDQDQGRQSQTATHASLQATQNPIWQEVLLVEFPKDRLQHEDLIVTVVDNTSKEILVEYEIPILNLKPFHQYNLELVKPNKDLSNSSRLYLSLILKYDNLVALNSEDLHMFGIEFFLRGFESPIANQLGSLIAVARLVPDWYNYKETMLSSNPTTANVRSATISFPSPHPTSFSVAGQTMGTGSPQVTVCGEPVNHPQWNQMFFVPGDMESLFTGSSAIVMEFYSKSHALSANGWMLTGPIGYCSQILNKGLAVALQQDNAKHGLKINGLPVQGHITSYTGAKPSVGLVVRLVVDKRPEALSVSEIPSLPLFGETKATFNQFRAQPITLDNKNPFGLPPFDAVQRLLPLTNPPMSLGASELPMPQLTQLPTTTLDPNSIPSDLRSTMDMRTLALLDYQMKEVDRYRTAMRKLATDLLQLKQDNSRLEEANSQYRRDLSQHDEISRMMVSANDLDNVTHSELIQKFVLLKKKLSDESTKRQELQTRTQKLQNELIKKNEKEKSLFKLEEAHESQQTLVQKMQIKLQKYKSLQETCKKQEQVIVELEKLLSKGDNGVNLSDPSSQSRIYIEENVRLRLELEKLKGLVKESDAKNQSTRIPSPKQAKDLDNSERLELYQNLERAEGRILGLEKQLTENARKWAKEKTTLQARLNEALMQSRFHSFDESRAMHDVGSHTNVFYSDQRKSSPKLDPLIRR